jgi:hypothetical protein
VYLLSLHMHLATQVAFLRALSHDVPWTSLHSTCCGVWACGSTRVWKIETELLVGVLLASSLPVAHVDRTAITRQPAGTCIALIWSRLVNSIHPIMGAWEIFMPCGLSKQYHDSMISLQRKTCVATGMCKFGVLHSIYSSSLHLRRHLSC